jgi:molybdopterin converting factor small subunit
VNSVSVKVSLHRTHRQFTGGLEIVEVQGDTVGDCLDHLSKEYPGIGEALFEKKGKLRNHIEVFHNDKTTYPQELAMPVKDGDEIYITAMLAGG